MRGKVKFFKADLGWGFIIPDDGGTDLFVHQNEVAQGVKLRENDAVTFDVGVGKKGRCANKVRLADR